MVVVAGEFEHGLAWAVAASSALVPRRSTPRTERTSIVAVRPRPDRIDRLPEQYFTGLLARVAAAAAQEGEEVIDLGRGNPDTGPPGHVVEALARAARDPRAHGYPPFRGIPALKGWNSPLEF
jgi:hypothetical protein